MPRQATTPLGDWFRDLGRSLTYGITVTFARACGYLTASGRFRKKHERLFKTIVAISSFLIAFTIWHIARPQLPIPDDTLAYELVRLVTSILLMLVIWLFFSCFAPLLSYTPHALTMRRMGLLRAELGADKFDTLLRELLREEPGETVVRVICITGLHLFREARSYQAGVVAPLLELARKGRVDVIMPISSGTNPTIKARWDTYSDVYRETKYPSVDDLVREADDTKRFLRQRDNNPVFEHNILCMWRVILLSRHCLVQNYFPNVTGEDIEHAPVFLFERADDTPFSYYMTFENMFDLIKRYPSPGPSVGAARAA